MALGATNNAGAQSPPNPTPDPVAQNIFYGATPSAGAHAPVIVFVHGLNGNASDWWVNNDMYASAYGAGFRTAFVSLNANNTPNNAPWSQNGAVLKGLFPTIAAHFSAQQFYVVAYDKGGLDVQAALLTPGYTGLDPAISALVKAVFMFATPNHGTALADWAFGAGQSQAPQLGLTGPGWQSLEVATVGSFRSQADPVFAASQLQFYTFAGDTVGTDPILTVTGQILNGLTPGPNDGLATISSVRLPYAYSMDIGETAANHYQMNQGHVSFSVANGSIQGLEREIFGFRRLMTGGFGDPSNTWTWSMKWFNHKLFVGTGREVNCVTYAALSSNPGSQLYPPKGGNCPSDPKDLRLAAEIWQYTPETNTWVRVFQSPEDIPIGTDASGQSINTARDIGFRSMAVFTESDGTQALYVGGVTSGEIFHKIAPYNTQGYPPPRILRTTDGVTFTPLPQDPGTFLGGITLHSDPKHPVYAYRSMVVFNGMLFVVAGDYQGSGTIIASSNPAAGDNAWFQASVPASQFPVSSLDVFAGHLWAIGGDTSNHSGYFAAYTNAQGQAPYGFANVVTHGGSTAPESGTAGALSSAVFQGHLYVGTGRHTELIRINPDLSWDLVAANPRMTPQGQKNPISGIDQSFDNQFNVYFAGMGVVPAGRHQGLVLGTVDSSSETQVIPPLGNLAEPNFGADVMMSPDGVNWTAITTTGFGDGLNFGVRAIESTPFGTFIGTARTIGGTQIWLDQTILDFSNDGVIDQADVAAVESAVGQAAVHPYDPRDLDQDGQITANDVQLITSQCTLANCAAALAPPLALSAPANLVAAPRSVSGSTVSLSWNPAPGAVDYRIYRQTQTPLAQFFPPQGIQITIVGLTLTIPQDLLNGKLNPFCPQGGTTSNPICKLLLGFEQALQPGSPAGFPTALTYLGKTSSTTYQEQAPTPLQSIYFVRAEDANGNLSEPSNVVGAPSDANPNAPPPVSLSISPGSLSFTGQAGSKTPIPAQSVQLSSTGAPLGFTAAASVATPAGGNWLQVSPGSGTAPGAPATTALQVTANATGLAAGTYSGAITITDANGNPQTVNVTFTVNPASSSSLVISTRSLSFAYKIGGPAPAAQSFSVSSSGSPLGFTVSASVSTPQGGTWLNVSPTSGTAPASPSSTALIVMVSVKQLSAGTYTGTITVTDPSGNSKAVGVTLTVTAGNKPPGAPPPTPDPTQPNLFYGAIPPNGPNGPVLVFVHGLGGTAMDWWDVTGNDMYDLAYQYGFRTAFMSLNLDNTPNNADIQTNAAMLQVMFPKILAYFGVSKVYFVCHSKGGLDLQAAIVSPQWIGIANAVIMLGTPNQGDALADWLFSPAGNSIGQALGLLNPGVQSLETANVLALRTQWDPIFQNAKIPFYTVSGNTFACPGGQTCITSVTGPILQGLTGGSSAPPNDGLVTQPETKLPTAYAMQLGVIHTDHFALRMGDNSFPFINARVMAQENQEPGAAMVSTNGFGDVHNTWAWSMQWFKGKLYVGTGREVACVTDAAAMLQTGVPIYPPKDSNCPADYHYLPLQAEIWEYTPQTNTWARVFQSPNSLQTTDSNGNTVQTARDIGFRGMTVVTEPDGTQALYAGGVTSGMLFAPQSNHSAWAPPRVLRSVDGVTWAPLPQDPGTFMGNLSQAGTQQFPIYSVRAATQYNGVLFLQVGDFQGTGRVISSVVGANPATGNDAFQWASPPTATLPVWILELYNNFLYAGVGFPNGTSQYAVYKTDGTGTPDPVNGYTWSPVVTNGAYATGLVANYAMSLQVFSDPTGCPGIGCLYVGTDRPTELIRIHPDDTWELVIGNPRTSPTGQLIAPLSGIGQYFNNGFNGHFWRMGVGGHGLYLSTWDNSDDDSEQAPLSSFWSQEFGTDLYRTSDGVHWQIVSKIAFGDGANTGGRSYASTPFGLFWGTARSLGGTQIFNLDNSVLDYNSDGVIDQNDVNLLTARLNTPAQPNDPMDLDQDGQITNSDLQLLSTQCTNPNCAVPPTLPVYITLPSPTVDSAPGNLGGTVSLSWNAVSGAADYVVYRIATAATLNAPPPGAPGAVKGGTTATPYGYPGPITLLARVTTPAYTEVSPTALQSLYFVRAEDASGNLSEPSNVVGGPSLGGPPVIQPASLVITPGTVAFSYQAGGAPPVAQTIQVSSTGPSLAFSAVASIGTPSGGQWLQVSPGSGAAPSSPGTTPLSVTADPTGLAPGNYSGTITITDFSGNAQAVNVTLAITAPATHPASLVVTPAAMTFSYQLGGASPVAQTIQVSSNGAPLSFTADAAVSTPAGGNWLQVSPASGSAPSSPGTQPLSVKVDPTGLAAGSYSATITFTDALENTRQVNVTFVVSPASTGPPTLTVSPVSLAFSYQAGSGALPAAQGLSIGSTGQPLAFTATASVANNVSNWLQLSAPSGTAPASPATLTLMVTVTPASLAAGTYSGTIAISSGSGNPQQVTVTLVVTPSAPAGALVVSAYALSFNYTIGGSMPAWQAVAVGSTGAALPFNVTTDTSWFQAKQISAATPAFPGNTPIYIGVIMAPPVPGSYSGKVTVASSSASNSPLTITVNLTVTAPTPPSSGGTGTTIGSVSTGTPPPPVVLPRVIAHLANGQGWKTTILLVNTDTQPQPFTLSFLASDGTPLVLPLGADGTTSSFTATIPPGQLRVLQTDGSGNSLAEGWANFSAANTVGGTVIFTAQSNGQPPSEAAVPLSAAGSTQLFVPFDQTTKQYSFSTGLALANPGSTDATVSVTFTDEFGQGIPVTGGITVPANGHIGIVLGALYPQIQGKRGVMQLSSNTEIFGLGIRFNGAAFTSIDALATANVPPVPKVISHIANGQGWKTTILLVNTDTTPAPFRLVFWKGDGTPLSLPLGADGTVSYVSGTIAPGNIRIIESDGSGDALSEGWASLTTYQAVGGTAIFTAQSNGQPPSEAAVPLSSVAGTQLFMPFDSTSGALTFATGLALANPNAQDATVSVTLTDDSGQPIAVTGKITVPAHGHYADVLSSVFAAIQGKRGSAHLTSNVPLYGLGIRYNGGAYTSIPALPSSPPVN
jgi:triacylglycerol esterase/lipase EstA (alpha/beta hydrolase family)